MDTAKAELIIANHELDTANKKVALFSSLELYIHDRSTYYWETYIYISFPQNSELAQSKRKYKDKASKLAVEKTDLVSQHAADKLSRLTLKEAEGNDDSEDDDGVSDETLDSVVRKIKQASLLINYKCKSVVSRIR